MLKALPGPWKIERAVYLLVNYDSFRVLIHSAVRR